MDKKTVLGFVLIIAIMIGFNWLNRPSEEEIERQQQYRDSLALVQAEQQLEQQRIEESKPVTQTQETPELTDSVRNEQLQGLYGAFAGAVDGEEGFITLENEVLSITLSTKGGRVYSALLKEHTAYDSSPLILFNKEESSFGTTLITHNNRVVNTEDLYFKKIENTAEKAVLRLQAGENAHLDFVYTLSPDDYMVRFEIISNNLGEVLAANMNSLDLRWIQKIPQLEKGRKYEAQKSQLMYKYSVDDVESLSESKDDSEKVSNKIKWIAYKDQYFSSVLIADNDLQPTHLESHYFENGHYLKQFNTTTGVAFNPHSDQTIGFYFYFGPNQYSLLKGYDNKQFKGEDLQLEKLVPLGWSLFRYVNKWIVIPLFDFFSSICGNIGLAILLLTLTVKLGLFPLTYKSFMSSAKMRVLRPQVEEINKKYPKQEDAMTRQQKVMELYRQAGVNPMSGCIPMVLQMPILFALFMFFPSAIELRHQSFLWADDLSTYDAIISWKTYIPLVSPYFGNHISLFCLLMTVTNMLYTKFNMDQNNTGQQQMPGMKMMMYIMPVFMLVFLNQYPAGLNYYYFVSTLITIIQTLLFRLVINEDKLLSKLESNKKKPKKKSGFMARLEEAQRQQQAALAKQRSDQRRSGGSGKRR